MSDLSQFAALAEFSDSAREVLDGLLESQEFRPGRSLFVQGQEAEEMMFITQGQVAVQIGGQERGEIGSGEVLGAASLVLIGTHECSAVAQDHVSVRTLSREGYLRLRADFPEVALDLQEGILRALTSALRGYLDESGSPD